MGVTSKVQAVNLALYGLHCERISSFSDSTNIATMINDTYDHILEQTITAGNWVCNTKRAQLSQDATAPDFGYAYQYILPSDYLKLQEFNDSDEYYLEFKIEHKRLLTDESTVKIVYSFKNEDTMSWSPEFVDVLVARMQAEWAFTITGSSTVEEAKWNLYNLKLDDAAASNAVQIYPKEIVADDLISVR